MREVLRSLFAVSAAFVLSVWLLLVSAPVSAATLIDRSLQLGSSQITTDTTYKIDFTTATTASIGSIVFDFCTTASGTCTAPTDFDTNEADPLAIAAQSGATGFSIHANTDLNTIVIARSAASIPASTVLSYTFSPVQNPSTLHESFFVRISTFATEDGTGGATDDGFAASSTADQISITGTMQQSLVFCVGTSMTGEDCGTVANSTLNFGDYDPLNAKTATSVMAASTNAGNGYVIAVSGNTLTSGGNTIAAMSSRATSTAGTAQFGLNLRANSSPSVGADPTGSGDAAPTADYNVVNEFKFVSGENVVSDNDTDPAEKFTVSYIANVPGNQPAGTYATTLTYVCTPTF